MKYFDCSSTNQKIWSDKKFVVAVVTLGVLNIMSIVCNVMLFGLLR